MYIHTYTYTFLRHLLRPKANTRTRQCNVGSDIIRRVMAVSVQKLHATWYEGRQ